MKKLWLYLIMPLLAVPVNPLVAQSAERPTPWFTISIEEGQLSRQAGYTVNDHQLLVKYTNVSDAAQKDYCAGTPWVYNEIVLLDGAPIVSKKEQRKTEVPIAVQDSRKIKANYTEANSCRGSREPIPAGQSFRFPLWISSDYDMTRPGTYTITVKRETYPFDAAKSVTVWSNTITIVVPAD